MKIIMQINKPLPGFPAGSKIRLEGDISGTPYDKYWRDRLKDAEIDGCCNVKAIPVIKKKVKNVPNNTA